MATSPGSSEIGHGAGCATILTGNTVSGPTPRRVARWHSKQSGSFPVHATTRGRGRSSVSTLPATCGRRPFRGVYADLDFECLRPVDALLRDQRVRAATSSRRNMYNDSARTHGLDRIVGNAFIASVPGDPFWTHVVGGLVVESAPRCTIRWPRRRPFPAHAGRRDLRASRRDCDIARERTLSSDEVRGLANPARAGGRARRRLCGAPLGRHLVAPPCDRGAAAPQRRATHTHRHAGQGCAHAPAHVIWRI